MSTFDSFEVEVESEEKGLYKLNLGKKDTSHKQKLLSGWNKYGDKIILVIGIILIAAVSFEGGFLKGQKNQKGLVMVNQAACAPCPKDEKNNNASSANNPALNALQNQSENQPNTENQKCDFAASKNSNKYHLASCQWAQKIKPENKICFSSKEEAESRGYQGAKCCIK
ncbi:MAG: hypothetical protein PHP25_00800 [Candidatus Moranbacteria bacterium]|nr:hypothetical protein [Candidatus Moranbacteria bacterium]